MSANIIAVTNRKGGVGKTTFAAHIAAGLASAGHKVGMIDCDSQGHLAEMFGEQSTDGLFNVLVENTPLEQHVFVIPPDSYSTADSPATGELYLLPGFKKTHRIASELAPEEIFKFFDMCEYFADLAGLDALVIDTQPSMSPLDSAIWMSVDWFVYITEPTVLSTNGLHDALEQLQRFRVQRKRYLGRDSQVAGIIPNMYRTNTVVAQLNVEDLVGDYRYFKDGGLVMSPVLLSETWKQACEAQQLVYTYEPTSIAAQQAREVTNNVNKRVFQWQPETE